jgi:tRNA(Ile2) C34 agmatinyltransferase TiaS
MFRISVCLVAAALVVSPFPAVMAQSTPAATTAAPNDAKPSRIKLSIEKLKEMKATWRANKPKMKACRQEVKAKGLVGDDRWFYMQDCMTKS